MCSISVFAGSDESDREAQGHHRQQQQGVLRDEEAKGHAPERQEVR